MAARTDRASGDGSSNPTMIMTPNAASKRACALG
jgi:hypothetical protein